jgi:hypothetical protein
VSVPDRASIKPLPTLEDIELLVLFAHGTAEEAMTGALRAG